ncbi:hypothetical protein BASA81_010561 [Batrachochytrium salamandrivorans]|nr:hypothetical protein BASA81_010561 [Batrachochytrium salamandrivorans]
MLDKIKQLILTFGIKKTLLLLVVLLVLQQTVGRRLSDQLHGLPPGPVPMPIIGTFYELSEPNKEPGLHKDLFRLSKKFGGIYTLYFGSNKGVVLNTPELWFEALNTKQDETSQRPFLNSFERITFGQGVAMNNGKRWRAIRTVLQTSVTNKQLGEAAEPIIMEEIHATLYALVKEVERGNGSKFDLRMLTRREGFNVIMRKIFNFRYRIENSTAEFDEAQDWIRIIFEHLAQGSPSDFMPIFGLFPDPAAKEFAKTCAKMHEFLEHELSKHKLTFASKGKEDMDFMDLMLQAQANGLQEQKSKPDTVVMSDLDIKVSCWDMMAGAMDTSSTTMEWFVLLMVNHPEIQAKCHQALDEVCGNGRMPTLADLPKLEYITACVCEMFRLKHFAPQGLPHQAAEDITLGGYNVPKGTQIFLNFYSLHMNDKLWRKPEEFRPERFLEEERELLDTVLHSELYFKKPEAYKFVPFGQGRRRCVGYGLGRIVIILKVLAWLHCFKWESANGQPVDLDTEILGITMMPKLQNVRAVPRPAAKILRPESAITAVPSL